MFTARTWTLIRRLRGPEHVAGADSSRRSSRLLPHASYARPSRSDAGRRRSSRVRPGPRGSPRHRACRTSRRRGRQRIRAPGAVDVPPSSRSGRPRGDARARDARPSDLRLWGRRAALRVLVRRFVVHRSLRRVCPSGRGSGVRYARASHRGGRSARRGARSRAPNRRPPCRSRGPACPVVHPGAGPGRRRRVRRARHSRPALPRDGSGRSRRAHTTAGGIVRDPRPGRHRRGAGSRVLATSRAAPESLEPRRRAFARRRTT